MGVTWPEMVRTVLSGHPLAAAAAPAGPAFRALKVAPLPPSTLSGSAN